MMSFLGIGGAFVTKLKNCSAYIKNGQNLFLIDCGENILEEILKLKILKNVENISILLTHFHTDHIGSLGSLVFYCDKIGLKSINIIYPNKNKLIDLINMFGIHKCNNLHLCTPSEFNYFKIKAYKQEHSSMEAYGYLIYIYNNSIYYSGDTKNIPKDIISMLINDEIDYFYQDIRIDKNDYHISIEELYAIIPKQYRSKVNCMHFDSVSDMKKIKKMGFSLVKKKRK